jgi:hypothetical protein
VAHLAVNKTFPCKFHTSTWHEITRWALATWKSNQLLFIHVIGKSSEELLESSNGRDIRSSAEARSHMNPFHWLEVIHLVRNILAVIQVIDWLPMRIPVGHRGIVLKRWHGLFGREIGIAYPTPEKRVDGTKTKRVSLHSRSSGYQIDILSRHLMRGCHNGYSGCRSRFRLAESLTRKHKTDYCC